MKEPRKLKAEKMLSMLMIAVGLILMAAKVYADSEPGAVPLALVVLGIGGYFVTRRRGGSTP